jgi:hypothetical protein
MVRHRRNQLPAAALKSQKLCSALDVVGLPSDEPHRLLTVGTRIGLLLLLKSALHVLSAS